MEVELAVVVVWGGLRVVGEREGVAAMAEEVLEEVVVTVEEDSVVVLGVAVGEQVVVAWVEEVVPEEEVLVAVGDRVEEALVAGALVGLEGLVVMEEVVDVEVPVGVVAEVEVALVAVGGQGEGALGARAVVEPVVLVEVAAEAVGEVLQEVGGVGVVAG